MSQELVKFHPRMLKGIEDKSKKEIVNMFESLEYYTDYVKFFIRLSYEKMLLVKDYMFKEKCSFVKCYSDFSAAYSEAKALFELDFSLWGCGSGFFKFDEQKQKLIVEFLGISIDEPLSFFREINLEKKMLLIPFLSKEQIGCIGSVLEEKETPVFFDKLPDGRRFNFFFGLSVKNAKFLFKYLDKKCRNNELFSIFKQLTPFNKAQVFPTLFTENQKKYVIDSLCGENNFSEIIKMILEFVDDAKKKQFVSFLEFDQEKAIFDYLIEGKNDVGLEIFFGLLIETDMPFLFRNLGSGQKKAVIEMFVKKDSHSYIVEIFCLLNDDERTQFFGLLNYDQQAAVLTPILMGEKFDFGSKFFASLSIEHKEFAFLALSPKFYNLSNALQAYLFVCALGSKKCKGRHVTRDTCVTLRDNETSIKFESLQYETQVFIFLAFNYPEIFVYRVAYGYFPEGILSQKIIEYIDEKPYLKRLLDSVKKIDWYITEDALALDVQNANLGLAYEIFYSQMKESNELKKVLQDFIAVSKQNHSSGVFRKKEIIPSIPRSPSAPLLIANEFDTVQR